MIKTIAELLDAIIEKEVGVIDACGITHGPTIGSQYEGLTKELLSRSLPTELHVVTGFLELSNGTLTRELDCIVTPGIIREIPHSDKYICKADEALAVIQVKKRLTGAGISDGSANLVSVRGADYPLNETAANKLKDLFQRISLTPWPDRIEDLSPFLSHLARMLLIHLSSPACVLLGYHGHKTHHGFRTAVLNAFSNPTEGNNTVFELPDIVLSKQFVCAKNIGMPWTFPVKGTFWPAFATWPLRSTAEILLECIWTRMVMHGYADDLIFGQDLEVETAKGLVTSTYSDPPGKWLMHSTSIQTPDNYNYEVEEWKPTSFTFKQLTFLFHLYQNGTTDIDLDVAGLTESDFEYMNKAGFVGRTHGNQRFEALLDHCGFAILKGTEFLAGDDSSGRFSRWMALHGVEDKDQ